MAKHVRQNLFVFAVVAWLGVQATVWSATQTEERIRGTLEKTARPGACAQITDALKETYFIAHSADAQKLCAGLFGKRVTVSGVVDVRPGTEDYYFKLKKVMPQDGVVRQAPAGNASDKAQAPLPPATPESTPEKEPPVREPSTKDADAKAKADE